MGDAVQLERLNSMEAILELKIQIARRCRLVAQFDHRWHSLWKPASVTLLRVNTDIKKRADEIKRRVAETQAKAAKLKAKTEQMEQTLHEVEQTLHETEQAAKRVHAKVRSRR